MWRTSSPELVRAQLGKLGAEPDPGGATVSRERARDQPVEGQIERLDQRLRAAGRDPGAQPEAAAASRSRAHQPAGGGLGRVLVAISRSAPGSVTVASTRSSSWSAVTPSLSAS